MNPTRESAAATAPPADSAAPSTSAGSARAEPWWGTRRSFLALCVIILGAAILRLFLFRGIVALDDTEYARFAYRLATGAGPVPDYTGPAVFPLRVGLIIPAAMVFRIFGLSEWSTVVYPMALSLLGIGLAYVCATRLFGWKAGLIAAALTAVFPWDIRGATSLVPDLPAAFFAACGVTAILLAERTAGAQRFARIAGGIGAGLFFGLSWLCKESVAYLVPFCLIWLVLSVRRYGASMLMLWAGVALGSLAVLIGEMVVYAFSTGDALHRFHEVERNYQQWDNGFFTQSSDFGWQSPEEYRGALLRRLFVTGPEMILLNPGFLYLPLLGLGVSLYAWLRQKREFLIPALWLFSLVLMFNFASSSTAAYTPLALFNRYLFPIFFPSILLVAGFLAGSVRTGSRGRPGSTPRLRRWAGVAMAGIVGWTAATQLWYSVSEPSTWLAEHRQLRERLDPETVLYSDALSLRALEFFHGYPDSTAWTDLEDARDPADITPNSLVLVYPPGIAWLDRNAGMWVTWPMAGPMGLDGYLRNHFYRDPPPDWQQEWANGDVRLYRVE